ncbi:MAG: hypothetical protein KJO21_09880 [Verrucomicrobiae bacterium]|nr:hypothetical protein [Verrucomicrobiae bacterium]NNJ43767.1 hypothetical protein [Akkermansiaceae bacterium]
MTRKTQKLTQGHYHCRECGALFKSSIRDVSQQKCSVCGYPPTGKTRQQGPIGNLQRVNPEAPESGEPTLDDDSHHGRRRITRGKRKVNGNRKLRFVAAGFLFAMLAMLVVRLVVYTFDSGGEAESDAKKKEFERQEFLAKAEEKKKRLFVAGSVASCEQVMLSFLNDPSSAGKAQYVYRGPRLSGVMERYYQAHPSISVKRNNIRIDHGDLLDVSGETVIGTLCKNKIGEQFEVIFIDDGKQWKIDWESFVRYDTRPWLLFPSGHDGDEGVFRLYMRVRDIGEDYARDEFDVVFYKPNIYTKHEFDGVASTSVRVPVDSPSGKWIQKMLQSEDADEGVAKDAAGFTLGDRDPYRYHRVRVRLRLRKEEGEETQLELLEILDNHWYGVKIEAAEDAEAAARTSGSERAE